VIYWRTSISRTDN